MNLREYQEKAKETAVYPKLKPSWIYPAFGLAGETGEILEKLKKILRDKEGHISKENLELIKKEIGDVLWYLSALSTELGLELDEIAEDNIKKLLSRKERNVLHGEGDLR
ncbi:MAG: nucleoside triphosphate pyrophosphohydrolase family protein [Candidatus Pacearchaeota archaeon]